MEAAAASESDPLYLMLDEIVYAQQWDLWLKTFYDDNWPVRIAATSSATAALRERRLESGVGRWSDRYLMPYLFSEFLEMTDTETQGDLDLGDSLADSLKLLRVGARSDARISELRHRFMLVGGFPDLLTRAAEQPKDDSSSLLEPSRCSGAMRLSGPSTRTSRSPSGSTVRSCWNDSSMCSPPR